MSQIIEAENMELTNILGQSVVPRDGIEPSTQGFSVGTPLLMVNHFNWLLDRPLRTIR